jgi:hypothetical protein
MSVMSPELLKELVPLDTVGTAADVEVLPDFPAVLDGSSKVWVTAVLERTAVIEPSPGEPKILVSRGRCLVRPDDVRIGLIAARNAARRGREAARKNRRAPEDVAA